MMDSPGGFMNRYSHISSMMLPTSSRSVNASATERSLLLGVIASHLSVLDARDNDTRTLRHKSLLWEQVTQLFNARSTLPRSKHQIQTLYKNMKAKAKKYQQRLMEAKVTDAPHTLPEPDPISELLLNLLAGEHEQRMMQIKQNALNFSGELTVDVSPDEILPDEFSPDQNNHSGERSSDEQSPNSRVKHEPAGSEETAVDDSLMPEDQTEHSISRSPADSSYLNPNSLPNAPEEVTTPTPTSNPSENDTPALNISPRPSLKRRRLLSQSSHGDTPRGANSGEQPRNINNGELPRSLNFFRHGGQLPFSRDGINEGFHHPFRFPDAHLPILPGVNKQCCCPSLHTELVSMAKEEHNLRMRATEEERRFKEEEHREKIKLMKLEQELCQRKIRLTERNITDKTSVHSELPHNPPLVGLNQWESLYNTNNPMNSMNMNLGSENSLAPKDINHTPYHNEYQKLPHQSNI